jgi:flagellar basal-body rod modification protein FlgD
MQDEDFIAQLAQFSALEQSYNMNQLLQESINLDYLQMQTINNTMATNLIGKEVQASYDNIYLGETDTPQINFATDEYAAEVKITISNSDGTVVRTLTGEDFSPGDNSITWDGRDDSGRRLESDLYSIEIEAYDAKGDSFTPSTYVRGPVEGVVYRDGAALLKVNGMEITLANVEQILEYAGTTETEEEDGQ